MTPASSLAERAPEPGAPVDSSIPLGSTGGRRGDSIFKGLTLLSGLLVLVILAGIAIATTRQAWPAFSAEGLSFITSSDWNPSENKFGALAFVLFLPTPYAIEMQLLVAVLAADRDSPDRRVPAGVEIAAAL